MIDFESNAAEVKSITFFRQRQETLKQRLLELCVIAYHDAMAKY